MIELFLVDLHTNRVLRWLPSRSYSGWKGLKPTILAMVREAAGPGGRLTMLTWMTEGEYRLSGIKAGEKTMAAKSPR